MALISEMGYKIAAFAGDGIGPELVEGVKKIIGKASELDNFSVEWIDYPHSAEHYLGTKELLAEKTLKEIKGSCNAIYCGTFGDPRVEAGILEKSVPGAIRNYFDQFASLRPVRLFAGVEGPVAGKTRNEINFTIIRESTEDFYAGVSGRAKGGKNKHQFSISKGACRAKFELDIDAKGGEISYHAGVLSRKGCERVIKYAFEYAKSKGRKKVTSIDKANMVDAYNFWRESFGRIAKEYLPIEHEYDLIDAAVMNFIRQPEKYDIIVAPNMFGDILGDLGTIIQGGLSFAARGNINPDGVSMFEPAHGSAPQLAGKGVVNPIAAIWSGALMLDNLKQHKSHELIMKAVESVLREGRTRTTDLGGNNTTSEMIDAILDKFVEIHD